MLRDVDHLPADVDDLQAGGEEGHVADEDRRGLAIEQCDFRSLHDADATVPLGCFQEQINLDVVQKREAKVQTAVGVRTRVTTERRDPEAKARLGRTGKFKSGVKPPAVGLKPTVTLSALMTVDERFRAEGPGRQRTLEAEAIVAGRFDVHGEVHADPFVERFGERNHANFDRDRCFLQPTQRREQVLHFRNDIGGLVDDQSSADVVVGELAGATEVLPLIGVNQMPVISPINAAEVLARLAASVADEPIGLDRLVRSARHC